MRNEVVLYQCNCCTSSNKAEKIEESETGQSMKLDMKEMIPIDSEPCTVQVETEVASWCYMIN